MNPGKPFKPDKAKEDFNYQIEVAERLRDAVIPLGGIKKTTKKPIHVTQSRKIVELAFMGVVAAWEEFLEAAMIRYLAGAATTSGYRAPLNVGKASDLAHAYQIIAQDADYDRSKHYLSWTSPREVKARAKFYFVDGAPFVDPLTLGEQCLGWAVQIRNRVAHASEKCRGDFETAARALLAKNKLNQSFRAGDLLEEQTSRHFPKVLSLPTGATLFSAYMQLFRHLANQIVP